MRLIGILVLLFGIALAGGSAWYVYQQGQNMRPTQVVDRGPQIETVAVVVAKRRLPQGTRIRPNMLKWVNYPKVSVPRGAFTTATALLGKDRKARRIVLRQIEQDAPVLASDLTGKDQISRMSMTLSEGKRALSIPINEVAGVAGLLAPGDRVDILLTRSFKGGLESVVILSDVLVIAVDRRSDRETTAKKVGRTATVEVSPANAQRLSLAQQAGRLSLTLRGMEISEDPDALDANRDESDAPTVMNTDELFGVQREAEPEPRDVGTTVRVRKGGVVTNVRVE